MRLERNYDRTVFAEAAIREAVARFDELFRLPQRLDVLHLELSVRQGGDVWDMEREDEFFAAYRNADGAYYHRVVVNSKGSASYAAAFVLKCKDGDTTLSVQTEQDGLSKGQRRSIQLVFQELEPHLAASRLSRDKPVVFIGHGRSLVWRDIKDHLSDKHGYSVEAYETGARAGHAVRDVLERMLERSSFALLVLTGDDESIDGSVQARQNVVHEAGLFQGRLGFARAIILLEEGTEEFSNIRGIEQIRFTSIKETFGEVVATLRREFDGGADS